MEVIGSLELIGPGSRHLRDHLLKIAAGYDELAKRSYDAEQQSEPLDEKL